MMRCFAGLCCALWLSACAGLRMPAPRSQRDAIPVERFAQAGVAEVDITPPPGLGLFGHGPEARIAEGTLLRLRCQVFVLIGAQVPADAAADALALAVCDLPAPSLLLSREVARRVRALGVPLGAERVWLSATHTHAGPGHYFASENLSGPFSARRIGFDRGVVDFLASRIAGAVHKAYVARRPARWGWLSRDVFGLSKNRAYEALRANRQLPVALAQRLAEAETGSDPAMRAVDPQLSLLRIEHKVADGTYQPAAALVVFGLHPTVIDNHNTLYGGDAFGYAVRDLSARLGAQHGSKVMVAFANGIEGDVTSVRAEATPREAQRIGRALSEQAFGVWDAFGAGGAQLSEQAPLRAGYRELRLSDAKLSTGARLCPQPELGTPAGGGANDHPTFLRMLAPYNPGVRARDRRGCHGPKYPIASLDGASKPGLHFPGVAPIGVARIGNGVLVTLPAELTSVAGLRIKESVALQALRAGRAGDVIAVAGLTHEYLEYVATADEYVLQHYEGASTLYGPHSAEFLREQVACVSRYVQLGDTAPCGEQASAIDQVSAVPYTLPAFHAAWLARVPDRAQGTPGLGTPRSARTPDGEFAFASELSGVAPRALTKPEEFGIAIVAGDGAVLDDEQGAALRARWDDARGVWTLTWTPDCALRAGRVGQPFRFRVRAGARVLESARALLEACPDAAGRAP